MPQNLVIFSIILVKLEMLWLSKIYGITYNLWWREYIPTAVASAQRNFSKLKLLKNCLRSIIYYKKINSMAWLYAAFTRKFCIKLILLFLKILHQEISEDIFFKSIEAL